MYYETDYLSHHGVIGQKWGVRRYQNKDGSLTAKGKRRRKEQFENEASEMQDDELRKSVNRLNLEKQYKDMELTTSRRTEALAGASESSKSSATIARGLSGPNSDAAKLVGGTSQLLQNSTNVSKAHDRSDANRRIKAMDLSKMTDEDLKKAVDRKRMEQQYTNLKSEDIKRGKRDVAKTLETTANIVLLTVSAVDLAMRIHAAAKVPAANIGATLIIKKAAKEMAKSMI